MRSSRFTSIYRRQDFSAALGTRFIRTMLFGVSGLDVRIFAGAALVLIASTMLAAYLPARRASRTDPLVSLRAE